MKRLWRATIIGIVFGLALSCAAQSVAAVPSRTAGKRSQGLLEYALGKINPADTDYGSAAEVARDGLVGYTIQSLYFWSNLISLGLLVTTSTALVLVLRTQDKREIIAADLIAQLWNGRVADREEILRRTTAFNLLVEANNAVVTGMAASVGAPAEFPTSVQRPTSRKARGTSESGGPKQLSFETHPADSARSAPDPDQKTKLLEGQNQALRNSERNLRERLNQVSQDLEQERRRNQSLKGA